MWGAAEMRELLGGAFAPWVKALGIEALGMEGEVAVFRLPCGDEVVRGGGGMRVLCGQAVAAAADTCAVLAISALNGRYRNMTTVDLTTHFLRPVTGEAAEVRVEAVSNGRRMAVARVELRGIGEDGAAGKLAATATVAFAYLED